MKGLLSAFLAIALLTALGLLGLSHFRTIWPRGPSVPSVSEIDRLKRERAVLHDRLMSLADQAGYGLRDAPKTGVVIGTPTQLAGSVVEQVVTGLLGQVTLVLKGVDLRAESSVTGPLLFRRRTFGELDLEVRIQEVKGLLQAAKPRLRFENNRIGIALPVTLAGGAGRASLRIQWDGKGLAAIACGDIDVTRDVKGTVLPASYELKGAFELTADDGAIVITPRFGEVQVKIQIEPDRESWAALDTIIDEKSALCRTVLKKVDVKQKIAAVLARGFDVKLPRSLFRPLKLPAAVEQSLDIQGVKLALQARPTNLVMTQGRIWYGADISVRRAVSPPAGSSRPNEQPVR